MTRIEHACLVSSERVHRSLGWKKQDPHASSEIPSSRLTLDFLSNRLTTRRTLKMASQGGYAVVDADEEVHATLSGAVFS